MNEKKGLVRNVRIADWLKGPLPESSGPPQLDPGWFKVFQFALTDPCAVVYVEDTNPGRKEYWDFAPLGSPAEYHWPNSSDTNGVAMNFVAITYEQHKAIVLGWDNDHPRWIFTGTQVS